MSDRTVKVIVWTPAVLMIALAFASLGVRIWEVFSG